MINKDNCIPANRLYMLLQILQELFIQKVPCTSPDLRDGRELKGAIHHNLRKQLSGLQSERTAGVVVLQLIKLCRELLEKVRDVPAVQPSQNRLNSWLYSRFHNQVFRSGIEAVEWTI